MMPDATLPDQSHFISWLEQLAPEGERLLIGKAFATDDGTVGYTPTEVLPPNTPLYVSTGSFIKARMEGKLRAKLDNIEHCLFLMLDDIGTKSKMPPIEPTWKIETSPGNYQWGYAYAERPTKAQQSAAVKAIAKAGFSDPGASNAVRWARIPGSLNKKKGFSAVLREFHPERLFVLSELCDALGVVPDAPRARSTLPASREHHTGSGTTGSNVDMAVLRSAVMAIPADIGRPDWIRVGMGIATVDNGSEGFQLWNEWSEGAPDLHPGDTEMEKQWESFNDDKPDSEVVSVGTVFYLAQAHGWERPPADVRGMFGAVQSPDNARVESARFMRQAFAANGLDAGDYPQATPLPTGEVAAFELATAGDHITKYYEGPPVTVRRNGQPVPVLFGDFKDAKLIYAVDNWFSAAALHEATGAAVVCVEGWAFGEIVTEDGENIRDLHTVLLSVVRAGLQIRIITDGNADDNHRLRLATFRMLLLEAGCVVKAFGLPDQHKTFGNMMMARYGSRAEWATGSELTPVLFKGKDAALAVISDDEMAEAAKSYTMSNADRFGKYHLDLTDRGAGSYILSRLGIGSFYYLRDRGDWVQWHNGAWRNLGKQPLRLVDIAAHGYTLRAKAMFDLADTMASDNPLAKSLKAQAARFQHRAEVLGGSAGRAQVLKDLMGRTEVAVFSKIFDADPWLLGVKNGVVDLRTGDLREVTKEDMMFRACPVRYIKNAEHPKLQLFLKQITGEQVFDAPVWAGGNGGDGLVLHDKPGRLTYLQRRMGTILIGRNVTTAMDIVFGPGANGKTVLGKLISATLGNAKDGDGYAMTIPASVIMSHFNGRDPEAPSPHLASTVGARFLLMSESKDTDRLNEQLIKHVTGGDEIPARGLYKEAFSFVPAFTPWLLTNHLPEITEGGKALWDRLAPFGLECRWRRPGANDADDAWLPPEDRWFVDTAPYDDSPREFLLSWMVCGCLDYQREGLGDVPGDVTEALNSYRAASDTFAIWMADHGLEFGPYEKDGNGNYKSGARMKFSVAYASYSTWCNQNGKKPTAGNNFTKRLTEAHPNLTAGKEGRDVRVLMGIKLRGT